MLGKVNNVSGKTHEINYITNSSTKLLMCQNKTHMAANVIVIDFPKEVEEKKKHSDTKLNEAIQAVCALLNSNGGVLKLHSATKDDFNYDKLIRKFEQRIKELVGGFESCKKFEISLGPSDENHAEVVCKVASSETFCTVNYHLYVPHETQVNLIAPIESLNNIRSILAGVQLIECDQLIKLGSHRRDFVKGQNTGCPESKTEQFKKVKHEKTNNVSIADRIVSKGNKFASTVSAFANHRGGHIYYGIKDNCLIEGEIFGEDEKEAITTKVTKAINKMLWPNNAPQRGKHWDIYFEPVMDKGYKQIPSTFVVVVTVVQCSGGVFTEKPESYRVVNGKVETIPFELWKKRVCSNQSSPECDGGRSSSNLHRFANRRQKIPTVIACRKAVGSKLEQSCLESRERLARFRNNGDKIRFKKYANELLSQSDCFKAIVWQQKAACQYREHRFEEAYICLRTSRSLLKSVQENLPVLEIENFYWESLVNRFLGNYEECDSCRILGMQRMESCPPDIIGAWFFFQEARSIERQISRNPCEMSKLIPQAKLCYIEALTQASVLEESTSVAELKQRCHNRLAMLHLGCFFQDNEIMRTQDLVQYDIEEAERMLQIVDSSSRVQGWPLTEFCRCEYLLARAQQNVRNWQQLHDEHFLELAQEETNTAHDICKKKNFQEMMTYVDAEIDEINVQLNSM